MNVRTYLLNGVSVIFKTLSWINLGLKSLRRRDYPDMLVISIDNLSFGGAGKTPLVMAILEHFQQRGITAAVVTRGYKSKFEDRGTAVEPHHDYRDVGDEAAMIKKRFPRQAVYVGKDRRASIERARADGRRIILLDDGLQSTHIGKDISILLMNPRHPYYFLRNFKFFMKREDYVLHYQPPDGESPPTAAGSGKASPTAAPITGTYHFTIDGFRDPSGRAADPGGAILLGFSALGDNDRFQRDLSAHNLMHFKGFGDHHSYTQSDLDHLENLRKEKKIDRLVCTEKDFIKLVHINLEEIPLIYSQNSIKFNVNLLDNLLKHAEEKGYV